MNHWLYLYPSGLDMPGTDWPVACWRGAEEPNEMTLVEAAKALAGQSIRVVLPMEACSWLRSEPWPGRRQPTVQALAYAIEEQLADDLENLHIAVGLADQARRYPVLVIDTGCLRAIVDLLEGLDLHLASVQVDAELLPADQAYGVWWGGRWLFGGAAQVRLALPASTLQCLRPRLPVDVCWLGPSQASEVRALLTSAQGTDLLQGAFRRTGGRRPWPLLLVSTLALFALSWGFTQARSQYLEDTAAHLYEQSVQRFQALYPEQTRIVDLSAQLKALAAGDAQAPRQMARLVQLVEQVVGGASVEVQRIEYRATKGWTVVLTANSFTELEQLRERGRQSALPIHLGSASKDHKRVQAVLTLEENG
ncbi:general secretion pathway protein GspL [Pseudomonas agarici]|uniref:Type II secretion system protein L n=1 Tax=Pseudomonas agarici TaxID=46677 RepID=A0A0X1T5T7_PSEAA|nr:type II secretion system protein GspL [Pseudomonas agarici]AMB87474.1 general secretion pathway protein GspL [Pseudomonas agarici]